MSKSLTPYPRVKFVGDNTEETFEVNANELCYVGTGYIQIGEGATNRLERRASGNLTGKAVYLPTAYDYQVVRDNEGFPCLIVLKRSC